MRNGCFERSTIFKTVRETERYILSNSKYLSIANLKHPGNRTFTRPFLQRLFFQFSKGLVSSAIESWFTIDQHKAERVYGVFFAQLNSQPDRVVEIVSRLLEISQSGQRQEKDELIHLLLTKNGTQPILDLLKKGQKLGSSNKDLEKSTLNDKALDCPNAGLVLLYPFLKPFFENIHLIEGDRFIDVDAQKQAVQSLYFLATGESQGLEEQYLMPKLLCGLSLEEYIHFKTELPDAVKQEADELLQSVIVHWSKLQNTSRTVCGKPS